MFYTGIDQHRASSVLTTLTAQGERLMQRTLPNDRQLLIDYFAQWLGEHRAVVEATGRWYWLRDRLVPQGIDLRLAHAKFLKAIAYAKVKADAVDSNTLTQLLRTGLIPEAHMIRHAQRGLRDVLRARLRLVERRSRAKNSLDRLLEQFIVPAVEQLPPLYQLQAQMQPGQITLFTEPVHTLERAIQDDLLDPPAIQRLLWIPGIGRIVAFTLALEVDDIQRFPTVRHFWSYCRLVPGAADSGGRHRHRASKDGNRYLKLAFSHAAVRRSSTSRRSASGTSVGSGRSRSRSPGPWWPRNWRQASMSSCTTRWTLTRRSKGRRSRGRQKRSGPGGQAPLPN